MRGQLFVIEEEGSLVFLDYAAMLSKMISAQGMTAGALVFEIDGRFAYKLCQAGVLNTDYLHQKEPRFSGTGSKDWFDSIFCLYNQKIVQEVVSQVQGCCNSDFDHIRTIMSMCYFSSLVEAVETLKTNGQLDQEAFDLIINSHNPKGFAEQFLKCRQHPDRCVELLNARKALPEEAANDKKLASLLFTHPCPLDFIQAVGIMHQSGMPFDLAILSRENVLEVVEGLAVLRTSNIQFQQEQCLYHPTASLFSAVKVLSDSGQLDQETFELVVLSDDPARFAERFSKSRQYPDRYIELLGARQQLPEEAAKDKKLVSLLFTHPHPWDFVQSVKRMHRLGMPYDLAILSRGNVLKVVEGLALLHMSDIKLTASQRENFVCHPFSLQAANVMAVVKVWGIVDDQALVNQVLKIELSQIPALSALVNRFKQLKIVPTKEQWLTACTMDFEAMLMKKGQSRGDWLRMNSFKLHELFFKPINACVSGEKILKLLLGQPPQRHIAAPSTAFYELRVLGLHQRLMVATIAACMIAAFKKQFFNAGDQCNGANGGVHFWSRVSAGQRGSTPCSARGGFFLLSAPCDKALDVKAAEVKTGNDKSASVSALVGAAETTEAVAALAEAEASAEAGEWPAAHVRMRS